MGRKSKRQESVFWGSGKKRFLPSLVSALALSLSPDVYAKQKPTIRTQDEVELVPIVKTLKIELPVINKREKVEYRGPPENQEAVKTVFFESPVDIDGDKIPDFILDITYTTEGFAKKTTLDILVRSEQTTKIAQETGNIEGFGPVKIRDVQNPFLYYGKPKKGGALIQLLFYALEYPQGKNLAKQKSPEFLGIDLEHARIWRIVPTTPSEKIEVMPSLKYDSQTQKFGYSNTTKLFLPLKMLTVEVPKDHQQHLAAIVNNYYQQVRSKLDDYINLHEEPPSFEEVQRYITRERLEWEKTNSANEDTSSEVTFVEDLTKTLIQYGQDYVKQAREKRMTELRNSTPPPPPIPIPIIPIPIINDKIPVQEEKRKWYGVSGENGWQTTGRWIIPFYENPYSYYLKQNGYVWRARDRRNQNPP